MKKHLIVENPKVYWIDNTNITRYNKHEYSYIGNI